MVPKGAGLTRLCCRIENATTPCKNLSNRFHAPGNSIGYGRVSFYSRRRPKYSHEVQDVQRVCSMERRAVGSRQAPLGGNAPHQHDRHDQSAAAKPDAKETTETKAIWPDHWQSGQCSSFHSEAPNKRRAVAKRQKCVAGNEQVKPTPGNAKTTSYGLGVTKANRAKGQTSKGTNTNPSFSFSAIHTAASSTAVGAGKLMGMYGPLARYRFNAEAGITVPVGRAAETNCFPSAFEYTNRSLFHWLAITVYFPGMYWPLPGL